jgi:glycosyltransferase involved in cell wall biosynthesis
VKVLMSADTIGGVFTYAVDLIAGLSERGVQVVLVTFGRRRLSSDQRGQIARAGVASLHESELALEWMPDPWDDVARAEDLLLALEEEEQPDIVHLNSFVHGAAPWRSPVLVAGHSCVWSWWNAVHGTDPPAQWNHYRDAVARGIRAAAALVAPSAAMLRSLDRHYGPLPERAVVVHNGSAVPDAPAGARKQAFVLAAGRLWDQAKNLETLSRAAARLSRPVLVAGDSKSGTGGQSGHGAGGAPRLLGRLSAEQLAPLRRRAAVFAAPARYEPFGLGILEAARDRCALVLGDIPSLRELWDGAAWFVEPDDDAELARALEHLLSDRHGAFRRGELAQLHARRYSVQEMTRSYEALYGDLVARPSLREAVR